MAYGVKYELIFSDVRGLKKKIQILKKDYAGSVLPMVCTNDPVVIEWKSDDDFYEPLIGSFADVNLVVTEDVSYDNFYEFGEREYQLKIWYESNTNVYTLYWMGFITNDIYSEAITITPYTIKIRALDGLGSLDGYNCWMPSVGTSSATLWEFIYHNLQYLGLDFNIAISNDIRISSDPNWSNVFEDVMVRKETFFHKSYIINNAKETLRSILIGFNCRIAQAYGQWIIINNSSYGDQRIIAGIQNGTYSGAGILTAKQGFLNGGTEEIKYYYYDYNGNYLSNATDNYLRIVPNYIDPLNNDLNKIVKRPLKKYQEIIDISQKKLDLNENASFEFDTQNWTIDTGTAGTIGIPFAGLKSLNFIDVTNNSSTKTLKLHSDSTGAIVVQGGNYQFLMSIRFVNQATTNRIYWYVKFVGTSSGNTWYWDNANKGWNLGTTIVWNSKDIDQADKYVSFKNTMENVPEYGTVSIGIGIPYVNPVGSHVETLIDNVSIRYLDDEINQYESVYFIREQSGTDISDVMDHSKVFQGNLPSGVFWGNFTNIDTYRRCQDSSNRTLEEIITQQRLNDFRSYSVSYEGTLYPNYGYLTMSMMNKVWLDFDNFTETDSGIIDSMKVNLKSNQFYCRFHIPNNYTDVSNDYRVSYQE